MVENRLSTAALQVKCFLLLVEDSESESVSRMIEDPRLPYDHITVSYILFDLIIFAKPLKPLSLSAARGTLAVRGR